MSLISIFCITAYLSYYTNRGPRFHARCVKIMVMTIMMKSSPFPEPKVCTFQISSRGFIVGEIRNKHLYIHTHTNFHFYNISKKYKVGFVSSLTRDNLLLYNILIIAILWY